MDEEIFTYKLTYTKPVELTELSESLRAIAYQFQMYITEHGFNINEDQIRLYVYEIEKGSIVAKIKALAQHAGITVEAKKVLDGFVVKTKEQIDYFLGKIDLKPEINIEKLQSYKKILQPVASDNGANLILNVEDGGTLNIQNLTINHVQANAAQNRINHEIGLLNLPSNKIKTKVLLYCYQARNDKKAKTGDMGIIESIDNAPVKTIYMDEKIKEKILEHPFDAAYIVDVEVLTVNGKAKVYKVLHLHDVVEK
jgi:hypothetical protein